MTVTLRAATEEDLPQIHSIFEYYVLETDVTFLVKPPRLEYIAARFKESNDRGLPYLVAVEQEKVVAYTYASSFRGHMLGYGHSVEMTIICHPEYTGKGVGSQLMKELLIRLRKSRHNSREASHENDPQKFEIKNVIAVMSVDPRGPQNGLGLRNWYIKWGFHEVGRLKNVGFKHGRTLDTLYMQLSLE